MLHFLAILCVVSAMFPQRPGFPDDFVVSVLHPNEVNTDRDSSSRSRHNRIGVGYPSGDTLQPTLIQDRSNEDDIPSLNVQRQSSLETLLLPHNSEHSDSIEDQNIQRAIPEHLMDVRPPPAGLVALRNLLQRLTMPVPATAHRMDRSTLPDGDEDSVNPVVEANARWTSDDTSNTLLFDSGGNFVPERNNVPISPELQDNVVNVLIHLIRSQSNLAWLNENRLRVEIHFVLAFLIGIAQFPGVNEQNLVPVLIATATHLMNTIGDPRVDTSQLNSIILAMDTYSLEERQSAEAIVNSAVSSGALNMDRIADLYLQNLRGRVHDSSICNLNCDCLSPIGNALLFSIPLPLLLLITGGILAGTGTSNALFLCLGSIGLFLVEASVCAFCCSVQMSNEE